MQMAAAGTMTGEPGPVHDRAYQLVDDMLALGDR